MLSTKDFKKQVETWVSDGNYKHISISAKKRLEAMGLMDLGVGSIYRWMEKDWFERAVREGVMVKDWYGKWIPVARVLKLEKVVGKRGMNEITKTEEFVDASRFEKFDREYKEFRDKKDKEAYKLSMLDDFEQTRGNLVESI